MRPCCNPVLLVRFTPYASRPEVFNRHTGPFCAGNLDPLAFNAWYFRGERFPLTGEIR
jgi:hypothetical protein